MSAHAYQVRNDTAPEGQLKPAAPVFDLRNGSAHCPTRLARAHARINEDNERRSRTEDKVVFFAHHDALTGLPNRFSFDQRLNEARKISIEKGFKVSLLFIDLDGFKMVNDTLGHDVGDALLCEAGRCFSAAAGKDDFVARLGGDEFGVIHFSLEPRTTAAALSERIVQSIAACREVDGHEVFVGASIGVAIADDAQTNAMSLLKHADLAMYRAKSAGGGTYRFFEREMQRFAQRRRELEIDLRKAASRNDFDLHYQPIVDLATQRVTGVEALMRWDHPEQGPISAQEFIALAEDTGLINSMGEWALRRACSDAAAWRDLRVAVNLSPRQFRNPGLVPTVVNALASAGLSPERLELEVTETAFLERGAQTLAMLNQLRALGVRISLDDFGAGYTGLGYLRDFTFDKLKVDQSFVRDMPWRNSSAAIVRAALGLGASLGMTTIGEGVETGFELACLIDEGCAEAQGFFFGEAQPRMAVPALIEKIETRAASWRAVAERAIWTCSGV